MLLFLLVFSCRNDNACIEADDFGDIEKETIIVTPYVSPNCTYSPDDYKNDYQAVANPELKQCFTIGACKTQPDPVFRDICEKACITNCKNFKSEPRWVTNNPSGSFGNGVSIAPNKLIYINATGSIKLVEGNINGDLQGCITGSKNSPYFGVYGNCSTPISDSLVLNGSYNTEFTVAIENYSNLYSKFNSNLLIFQKYPSGYDSQSNIPINSDPDYTECIPKYPNDSSKISCSENDALDNYPSVYNNQASSRAYDFGTDKNFLISNGGFVRSNYDNFIEEEIIFSPEIVDVVESGSLKEIKLKDANQYGDRFLEIKVNDSACYGYKINVLKIFGEEFSNSGSVVEKDYYTLNNIILTSSYTEKIIPYYNLSKIKFFCRTICDNFNFR